MTLQQLAQYFIYIHAGFGGIALLAGMLAILVRKGSSAHKRSGKLFFLSMLISALLALIISAIPKHESSFLFTIGVFSTYLIASGYRALFYRYTHHNFKWDKTLSYLMILTGLLMILYPLLKQGKINIILAVFGLFGFILGLLDIQSFKDSQKLKRSWLKQHVGKMLGGYIAATTAFIVVNKLLPGIYGWLVPTFIGSAFIMYWLNKLKTSPLTKNYE